MCLAPGYTVALFRSNGWGHRLNRWVRQPAPSALHFSSMDLLLSPAPCFAPGCEKPGTPTCARCQGARYCSKDCQRAAWSSHKTSCTASRRRVVAALDPEGGRLLEADAREFDAICVMARDCANQLHHLCDDFYELADDRVANGACVRHLGAYVYTHFLAAPMGDGVLAMMRRKATETLSHPAVTPVQARVWDRINADLQVRPRIERGFRMAAP